MTEKQKIRESFVRFKLIQSHGVRQGSHGFEADGSPIFSLGRSGIGEGGLDDLGKTHHRAFIDAVVIKHRIADLHLAEKVPGLVIADTVPDHFLFLQKTGEGVGGGFLFDEPVVHGRDIDNPDNDEDED